MSGPGRAGRCGDTEGQGYSGVVWKRLGTWRVCPPVAICAPATPPLLEARLSSRAGLRLTLVFIPLGICSSQFLDISVVPGVVLGT